MPFTARKIQKETDTDTETEKIIYYDFMRFDDSGTVPNLLQQLIAFIRAYLNTILKTSNSPNWRLNLGLGVFAALEIAVGKCILFLCLKYTY